MGCAFLGVQIFRGTKVFSWDTKCFFGIQKLFLTFPEVKSGNGGGSTVGNPKEAAKAAQT